MGTFDSYHSRGEAGPRIDCLDTDKVTTSLSYTWTDIAAAAYKPHDNIAPVMHEDFILEEKVRVGIDGTKIIETGGLYYKATLDCKWVDKSTAGEMAAVLNHCFKGGNYSVNFYPHSDNTDIYFRCAVRGKIGDAEVQGQPWAGGHSAHLVIIGLDPFEEIPWPVTRGFKFMATGSWGAYTAAEKLNSQMGDKSAWAAYSTSEKENTIGYLTNTSQVVEIE